ncbi:MAG TPA: VOC family protein [Fimbriimonas sp.]|nr:VOC family protein [Fimbriimonas sp.]
MSSVPPVRSGFHTITPYLIVDGADAAIELYEKALGAEVLSVHKMPNGKVLNAQLKIGDSMLMLNDEWPDYGAIGPKKIGNTAVTIHLYVDDVDALWKKATAAGFEVGMPLDNQPWGDRYGSLKDPFGHSWSMATHKEDVSEEELARRMGGG